MAGTMLVRPFVLWPVWAIAAPWAMASRRPSVPISRAVGDDGDGFYVEVKPLNDNAIPEALKVSGFDLAKLAKTGEKPDDAFTRFRDWVAAASVGAKPVFVGFNAGFDWSFVNWYFVRFLGENPFGFAPLDVKSSYMGMTGCNWEDTKSSRIRSATGRIRNPAASGRSSNRPKQAITTR